MITHQEKKLSIIFGQKADFQGDPKSDEFNAYCSTLCIDNNLDSLTLLQQTHGVDGHSISYKPSSSPALHLFELTGDYLVTQQPQTGLAILTADCLPIIFYDQANSGIAIAHSGWRGSTQNIVEHVLEKMIANWGVDHNNLQLFFGPSAGPCCYKVEESFRDNIAQFRLEDEQMNQIIFETNGQWYFDNAQLTLHLLYRLGIQEQQVSRFYNHCTIHNQEYHSYRRDGEKAGRQLTIVCLKQ